MIFVSNCSLPQEDFLDRLSALARYGNLFDPAETSRRLGVVLYPQERDKGAVATLYLSAGDIRGKTEHVRYVVANDQELRIIDRRAIISFDELDKYGCFSNAEITSRLNSRFEQAPSLNSGDIMWRARRNSTYTLIFLNPEKSSSKCAKSLYILSKFDVS